MKRTIAVLFALLFTFSISQLVRANEQSDARQDETVNHTRMLAHSLKHITYSQAGAIELPVEERSKLDSLLEAGATMNDSEILIFLAHPKPNFSQPDETMLMALLNRAAVENRLKLLTKITQLVRGRHLHLITYFIDKGGNCDALLDLMIAQEFISSFVSDDALRILIKRTALKNSLEQCVNRDDLIKLLKTKAETKKS